MKQTSTMQTTLWVMVVILFSVASSVPVAENENDLQQPVKRSALWSGFLDVPNKFSLRPAFIATSRLGQLAGRLLNKQKRYRPAMQSRSGGMSLCLWKVCPAAPWLLTKRDVKNY